MARGGNSSHTRFPPSMVSTFQCHLHHIDIPLRVPNCKETSLKDHQIIRQDAAAASEPTLRLKLTRQKRQHRASHSQVKCYSSLRLVAA
mmetsp:Transcript_35074/g.84943  ORF Transcript_35074/g.84943 Transcript_35074/m.84943 type:complete len:89 (+) Transcript_35074:289-555(+)